jgi:hypothetical protein
LMDLTATDGAMAIWQQYTDWWQMTATRCNSTVMDGAARWQAWRHGNRRCNGFSTTREGETAPQWTASTTGMDGNGRQWTALW